MPSFNIVTEIAAPPQVCFDLARDMRVHAASLEHTGERVVTQTTEGLLGLDDEVTFEGRHAGVRWRLTSRITEFEPPHRFRDEQVDGPFVSFVHDHLFQPSPEGTVMIDRVNFDAPGSLLTLPAARWFLRPYLRRLLAKRAEYLKRLAEAETT